MRKVILAMLMISVLLLLVACESKTTGKRVAIPERQAQVRAPAGISGAAVVQAPNTGETGKSAADVLKDLQDSPTLPTTDGAKSGTFYPPVAVTGTEREALKEKTRALFTQSSYDPNIEADDEFGSRYHDSSGDLTNLPENYEDSGDN